MAAEVLYGMKALVQMHAKAGPVQVQLPQALLLLQNRNCFLKVLCSILQPVRAGLRATSLLLAKEAAILM